MLKFCCKGTSRLGYMSYVRLYRKLDELLSTGADWDEITVWLRARLHILMLVNKRRRKRRYRRL